MPGEPYNGGSVFLAQRRLLWTMFALLAVVSGLVGFVIGRGQVEQTEPMAMQGSKEGSGVPGFPGKGMMAQSGTVSGALPGKTLGDPDRLFKNSSPQPTGGKPPTMQVNAARMGGVYGRIGYYPRRGDWHPDAGAKVSLFSGSSGWPEGQKSYDMIGEVTTSGIGAEVIGEAVVDQDGSYTIKDVKPGKYIIAVQSGRTEGRAGAKCHFEEIGVRERNWESFSYGFRRSTQ